METRELPNLGMGGKKTLHTSTFKTKHNGGGRGEEAVCALGRHIKAGSRRPGWFTLPPKASWRLGSSITWGWRKQCTREAHRGPTQSVETRELHLIPKRNLEKKKKSTGTVREEHREASPTIQTARVTTTKRERLTRHVGWVKREKRPSEARKRPQPTESFHVTHFKDSVSAPICRYNKDR